MSGDPSRRHFLAIVGPGAVGCALAGCSSTAAPPAGDLAQSRDLAARDLGGDIAAPRDMATPDLTTPPDLSSPPDLACGGVPVPAAQMPGMDQAVYWSAQNVFIAQDSAGYMALSPTCSHMGCSVTYAPRNNGQAFICPCHGTTFALPGDVISGLAPLPLEHLGLCWKDASKQQLLLNPRLFIDDTSQRA